MLYLSLSIKTSLNRTLDILYITAALGESQSVRYNEILL